MCGEQEPLVENRNHVWRTGTMCGEQEPCVESRNHVWRTGTMCGEQEPGLLISSVNNSL